MKEIRVGNVKIAYNVRESDRTKRMTINVTPGNVEVVIPHNTPDESLEKFIYKKRLWIFEKVNQVDEAYRKQENVKPVEFKTGSKIPYRGRRMKLHVSKTDVDELKVEYRNGFYIAVPKNMKNIDFPIQQHLESWMKKRLDDDCWSIVNVYSKKLNLKPKKIRVKEQKHLWGSCSKDGTININWHLVFAPKKILEYVVVHEICHLKYRSHSDSFWRLLASVFPEWELCKLWLEKNEQVWEMRI